MNGFISSHLTEIQFSELDFEVQLVDLMLFRENGVLVADSAECAKKQDAQRKDVSEITERSR